MLKKVEQAFKFERTWWQLLLVIAFYIYSMFGVKKMGRIRVFFKEYRKVLLEYKVDLFYAINL